MPDGDLMWFDATNDFLGPYGATWRSNTLSYSFLTDDGEYQIDVIDPEQNPLVPNVASDFESMMSAVKYYGWALRGAALAGEQNRLFGMAAAYVPYSVCDIKQREPYKKHDYVRLFGQTMERDDPGNMLYGYGAAAAGYSPRIAVAAGGVVQMLTQWYEDKPQVVTPTRDHLKDSFWILRGIGLYRFGGQR